VFPIVGILVVLGAVLGGYLMEKGNLLVLLQPAELLMIGGAAVGTLLIANPIHILKGIGSGVGGVFSSSRFGKARYLETLRMMFGLLNKARREGNLSIEQDIEAPQESKLFAEYPAFLKDHHTRDFVCDTLRMMITGGVEAFDIDQMMELDMEVQHHDASQPISALTSAWSSRWVRWVGHPRRSATRWRPRWSARSSASCCATVWSDRSAPR
jgi:chemotaxis protein MotA